MAVKVKIKFPRVTNAGVYHGSFDNLEQQNQQKVINSNDNIYQLR
jgi:hypothetical protein